MVDNDRVQAPAAAAWNDKSAIIIALLIAPLINFSPGIYEKVQFRSNNRPRFKEAVQFDEFQGCTSSE